MVSMLPPCCRSENIFFQEPGCCPLRIGCPLQIEREQSNSTLVPYFSLFIPRRIYTPVIVIESCFVKKYKIEKGQIWFRYRKDL